MTKRQMILGVEFGNGYGTQPGSWRTPGVDPTNYANVDALVRYAQAAERGKLQFLFMPDGPSNVTDLDHFAPGVNFDPLLTLVAVARGTERIGFVATGSTTFNEPYNLARQFKALDVISHGRAGWNAVTSSTEEMAANFGQRLPSREDRYGRAHEVIQLVQALWGSWGKDAWVHDQASGKFAKAEEIAPINLGGQYVASRGPLYIPPSEQGQPVIFQAGGGANGLSLAGRFASGVIGATFTIEDARSQRESIREAARQAGRDPDEIKFFAGVMPTIASTKREAMDRRLALGQDVIPQRLAYLGQMLGIVIPGDQLDQPLTPEQMAAARPSPHDPRTKNALRIAREGWAVRDVLAHGVIDYHPVIVGPPSDVADHMQEWFEAGACDGFWLCVDVYEDGIDAFVDDVVPILQERGLFHRDYEGSTLREHLGVPYQYGLDTRIAGAG